MDSGQRAGLAEAERKQCETGVLLTILAANNALLENPEGRSVNIFRPLAKDEPARVLSPDSYETGDLVKRTTDLGNVEVFERTAGREPVEGGDHQ